MSDWQAGDLALCVRGGWVGGASHGGPYPEGGAIYTVAAVRLCPDGSVWLHVAGAPDNIDPDGANWGPLWIARRFRKIRPLTDEEREEALRELTPPIPVEV